MRLKSTKFYKNGEMALFVANGSEFPRNKKFGENAVLILYYRQFPEKVGKLVRRLTVGHDSADEVR